MLIDHVCATKVRRVASCEQCYRFSECLEKKSLYVAPECYGKKILSDGGCTYYVDSSGACIAVTTVSQAVLEVPECIYAGRRKVLLTKDGESLWRDLAEIVYEAFVGPIPEGRKLTFADGDPRNCQVGNIVLAESKPKKSKDGFRVIVIKDGFTLTYTSIQKAAKEVGVDPKDLSNRLETSKRGEVKIRTGVFVTTIGGQPK